jgi:hypothetical protein
LSCTCRAVIFRLKPRIYEEDGAVSFILLIMMEYEVCRYVRGYVRLAIESASKTLPWLEVSCSIQLPRLAYRADEKYFVPTEGISRGLVNCQRARMTMMIRRIEMRIFPLRRMTVEISVRPHGSPPCYWAKNRVVTLGLVGYRD